MTNDPSIITREIARLPFLAGRLLMSGLGRIPFGSDINSCDHI